ncbi:MAG: A/G-specific adenine glycosylase [Parafilimonas sp.]
MKNKTLFRNLLLKWHHEENKRMMPWKGEKDPYKVWLSEIILQQTRVEQGWSYYEKFITAYPTITQLARAKDETVFKLWEGLGYYTRCKNLLHTARFINENYAGKFPSDYNTILGLKGIGSYTASAIASFCFDLSHAVVDGNVLRILSRYFGIELPVDSTEGKSFFNQLAKECLDKNEPAEYNQSIMDFGATICKPAPLCNVCVMNKTCIAFKQNKINVLPVKIKKLNKKERWFSYFIFSFNKKTFVQQRTAKDIWQNLHEFYLEETGGNPEWNIKKIKDFLSKKLYITNTKNINIITAKKQMLTHQIIQGYFIAVELNSVPATLTLKGEWLNKKAIQLKAFPQFINQFNNQQVLQLQIL